MKVALQEKEELMEYNVQVVVEKLFRGREERVVDVQALASSNSPLFNTDNLLDDIVHAACVLFIKEYGNDERTPMEIFKHHEVLQNNSRLPISIKASIVKSAEELYSKTFGENFTIDINKILCRDLTVKSSVEHNNEPNAAESSPSPFQHSLDGLSRVGLFGGSEDKDYNSTFELSDKAFHYSLSTYERPSYLNHFTIRRDNPLGLVNTGNSCYINSAIQNITANPLIRDYYLNGEYRNELVESHFNRWGSDYRLVTHYFVEVVTLMWRNPSSSSVINSDQHQSYLKRALVNLRFQIGRNNKDDYENKDQQDSREFSIFLINTLHEDTNMCLRSDGNKPASRRVEETSNFTLSANKFWQSELSRESSTVDQLFIHQNFRSKTCPACNNISTNFDISRTIDVNIQQEIKSQTLKQCIINTWNDNSSDSEYLCEGCHKRVSPINQNQIMKTPPTLQFHLKRYNFITVTESERVDNLIHSPFILDVSEFMHNESKSRSEDKTKYMLISTIDHLPSAESTNMQSGHYISYGIGSDNNWYKYNDGKVSQVSMKNVMSENTYILQYLRLDKVRECGLMEAYNLGQEYDVNNADADNNDSDSSDNNDSDYYEDSMRLDQQPLTGKEGQRTTRSMRNQSVSTESGGGSVSSMDDR